MSQNVRGNDFLRPSDFGRSLNEDKTPGGKIKGLKCPDCGSQAFRTDQAGIAVCGDYPGWYFKYWQDIKDSKPQTKIVMEGGDYVEVPLYITEVITKHP